MSAEYSNKLFEIEQQLQGVSASDVEAVEDIIGELYNAEPYTCNAQIDSGLVFIDGSYELNDERWNYITKYELYYWKEHNGELCSEVQITIHDVVKKRVDDERGIAGAAMIYKLGRKGTIPTKASVTMRDLRYTKTGLTEVRAFDRDEFIVRTREMNQFDVKELVKLLLAQLDMSMSSGTSRT